METWAGQHLRDLARAKVGREQQQNPFYPAWIELDVAGADVQAAQSPVEAPSSGDHADEVVAD